MGREAMLKVNKSIQIFYVALLFFIFLSNAFAETKNKKPAFTLKVTDNLINLHTEQASFAVS